MSQNEPTSVDTTGSTSLEQISVDEVAAAAVIETQEFDASSEAGAAPPPLPSPLPLPLPFPPALPFNKRPVSGRYLGQTGAFRLELRVDVDRVRPLKKLSGDFYSVSGATVNYFGSFLVDNPTITVTSTQVRIRGTGKYTFGAGAPVITVTIPRRLLFQPAAPATVQFSTASGSPGASYQCGFVSHMFRSVRLETDRVSDVATPVFATYNTGALPSGGPARNLSVVSAFGEAGIEMVPTAGSNTINVAEAGATWSNAELHASMQRHFSLFRNVPQWATWLVVAQRHDYGPGLYGIMFDQAGPQRQGCAVFHQGIGGMTAEQSRLQLYTYVHELGHCFNLLHSWQKSFATPPQPNRPTSLSFMNYPWGYPSGPTAFWNSFAFQFDDLELAHLRHAFRNNIVMGGNPFATGSSLENPEIMGDPIEDQSGLRLRISTKPTLALGEPVVLTLTLAASDERGCTVHPYLHPNLLLTNVVIAKPSGQVVAWEPYVDHLVGPSEQELSGDQRIEASAYIGFGKGGMYFDQPGVYRLRAVYQALDGSRVMSNVIELRVRYPVTAKDDELAELLMGQEQGALFYLLGSDAPSLKAGNDAFDKVLDKYGDHPLADYVRLAKGINAARTFKTIAADAPGRCHVRKPALAEANKLLASATGPKSPVDDISKTECKAKLAAAQKAGGDDRGVVDLQRTSGTRGDRKTVKIENDEQN